MLNIQRFVCNPIRENTYVVSDETKECVIVDCGAFYEPEKEAIKEYIEKYSCDLEQKLIVFDSQDFIKIFFVGNKTFPIVELNFILKCCETAIKEYPNFATALILQAETHKKQMKKEQNQDKAKQMLLDLEKEYAHIHEIGYRNMPEDMYLNWLVSLKTERKKYENKSDKKEDRNV